eukprot:s556_g1.t1
MVSRQLRGCAGEGLPTLACSQRSAREPPAARSVALCLAKRRVVECISFLSQAMAPHLGPALAVSAGYQHTCALNTAGQLVCFGRNEEGQCDVPADLGPVVAVSAGYHHTCVITTAGQLRCFGANKEYVQNIKPGQVVNLQQNSHGLCDVPAMLGQTLAVAVDFSHTCAVRADGRLVCFGHPNEGKCGYHYTCAITADRRLVCFGLNKDGQCNVPEALGPVSAVSAGLHHTCVITADGDLVCFGKNRWGQCDVPEQVR